MVTTQLRVSKEELKTRLGLSLEDKVRLTELRIQEVYEEREGRTHVAFSGGLDSTVLLHIARDMYPHIPAVFCDTGLEFPEIRSFVRTFKNVTWLKPHKSFVQVLSQHGHPVVSKRVAIAISRYRGAKDDKTRRLRKYGGINPTSGKKEKLGVIPRKYHYLINAPFKISDYCCDVMKKMPARRYTKATGSMPMVGEMADDCASRQLDYMKRGCNGFHLKSPKSTPIAFWTRKDVLSYLSLEGVKYSQIYDLGYKHTGCTFCMFGLQREQKETGTNRFETMKVTHRRLYDYCTNNLGLGAVLGYMSIPH